MVAKRLPVCIIVPEGAAAVRAVGTVASLDGNYGSAKKNAVDKRGVTDAIAMRKRMFFLHSQRETP